ncbi:M20/M25/M40 family metallo-hydrolase [Xanthocytophaga flava]|nr:M20/M25/M40 family metallo-hydrolase [Xanthocytophaga flavus]
MTSNTMKRNALIGITLSLLSIYNAGAQTISTAELKKHITILASDKMEGRGSGKKGGELAADYISSQFKVLKLVPRGDKAGYFQHFGVKNSGTHGAVDTTSRTTKNVIGYLDNGATKTIVIGAHYDHLGMGHDGGSLDTSPLGKIHNGADDNASGVAGVLELAKYYSQNKEKEKVNFLFICFSGEEMGLLGSKYFTDHPTIDLSKIDCMLNMDMVGRLPENKTLIVSGVGTSPSWGGILRKYESANLKVSFDSSGIGASDHTSFYLKDIPVLHFFTGSHSDYHKPGDDADKINYAGEQAVLQYIIQVISDVSAIPHLAFTPTKNNSNQSASVSMKVTMGIMPSYASDGNGLKVDAVSENKPAKKAGVLAGDVIVAIDDHKITDIHTYMEALNFYEKGASAQVKIRRGAETVTLTVQF